MDKESSWRERIVTLNLNKFRWVEWVVVAGWIAGLVACSLPFKPERQSISEAVGPLHHEIVTGLSTAQNAVLPHPSTGSIPQASTASEPFSLPSLPSLPSAETLPTMHAAIASITPVLASPSAPAVLTDLHRWFYVAVILCVVAAIIAGFTTHFLACIKFALAAAVGTAMNFLFGVVIGSFVLACLASFAGGLVMAWYILNGRHRFEPSVLESELNSRLQALEKTVKP